MKRPTIKKITNIEDHQLQDEECLYYLQYDEAMTTIMLTIKSGVAMKPEEFFLALQCFMNDCSENPDKLFVEEMNHEENQSTH